MNSMIEILILVIYLAVIYTMVRPGSQGPSLISSLGDSLASLIKTAIGNGGQWSTAPSAPMPTTAQAEANAVNTISSALG